MTSDGIERLTHFQVKALARDLRARVIELEAERDALLRRLVRRTYEGDGWYAQDGGRYALTDHGWGFYRTEAEAIKAVRKAAGLD